MTKVRAAVEELDPDHFSRRRPARVVPVPEPVAVEAVAASVGATAVAVPDAPPVDAPSAAAAESLADSLERLAALHGAGALTDGEFAAAKRHVLEG